MFALPPETPVTTPPETVATPGLSVPHTPSGVVLEKDVVDPAHIVCIPVRGATVGTEFTIKVTSSLFPLHGLLLLLITLLNR